VGQIPGRNEIANMPFSKSDLKSLLDYLDRPNPPVCTHTFKETLEFLSEKNLDQSKVLPWLQENGAGCDCEVIFNVDDAWGEFVGRVYIDEDSEDIVVKPKESKPWWKFW